MMLQALVLYDNIVDSEVSWTALLAASGLKCDQLWTHLGHFNLRVAAGVRGFHHSLRGINKG